MSEVTYPVDVTLAGLVVGQAYSIVATPSTDTGAASESAAVILYRGIFLLICFSYLWNCWNTKNLVQLTVYSLQIALI